MIGGLAGIVPARAFIAIWVESLTKSPPELYKAKTYYSISVNYDHRFQVQCVMSSMPWELTNQIVYLWQLDRYYTSCANLSTGECIASPASQPPNLPIHAFIENSENRSHQSVPRDDGWIAVAVFLSLTLSLLPKDLQAAIHRSHKYSSCTERQTDRQIGVSVQIN